MARFSGYYFYNNADPPPESGIDAMAKDSGYCLDPLPLQSGNIGAMAKCSGYGPDPPRRQAGIEAMAKCSEGHDRRHRPRSGSDAAMPTRCRSSPPSPLGFGARAECSYDSGQDFEAMAKCSHDSGQDFEAMAKCSYDPGQDFEASIAEMVAAHDEGLVHRPRDMLELLRCYLSLNAEECHATIVVAFTRVWLQLLTLGTE
jgi:uncharacterized protein (TIGR01568 family)